MDWDWWHVAWGIGCGGVGILIGAVWAVLYFMKDRTDHNDYKE